MIEIDGIFYLEYEDAINVYAAIFQCTSQEAEDQLRSRTGLESALARPLRYAEYGSADIPVQAAVLAHGLAENQPFIEGNKRTAYFATIAFLGSNNYQLSAPQTTIRLWIEELSAGLTEDELASRIRTALLKI